MTQDFFTEVHMLDGKLVLIVVIHSLGGSRANWITRQTRNRVPHNQHKMRITQATSNPLEYLLALHRGKVKNLHTHHDQSRRQAPSSTRRSSQLQAI